MKTIVHNLLFIISAIAANAAFGQATLITNPPGGHYCQCSPQCSPQGGIQFLIEVSQSQVTYLLRKNGVPGNQASVTGNGGTVPFPGCFGPGNYHTEPPTNSITVIADPCPLAFTLLTNPSNGHYCNYPSTQGVEIYLSQSEPGTNYQLYKEPGSQQGFLSGGGNTSFGYYQTGNYYVVATKFSNGCTRTSNTVSVIAVTPPTANFTTSPLIPPPCADSTVHFYGQPVSGVTWLWNFNDPNSGTKNTSTTCNPSHVFEAWGTLTQVFNVRLVVTDIDGCKDSITKPVEVTQKPDDSLTESLNLTTVINDTITFSYCGTQSSAWFSFKNTSTTQSSNTWYTINWGDGTPNFSSQIFDSIDHFYTGLGYKTLTYTINGSNGCNSTKKHYIFIGSTPQGGIGSFGNYYGVAPFNACFPIQPSSYNNTPGTIYIFDWGDGSQLDTLWQEELPTNQMLCHTYETGSFSTINCTPSSNPQFAFKASCTATNPCLSSTTTVCPIIVSYAVSGGFGTGGGGWWGWWSGDTNTSHLVGCNPVTFNNTTTPGFYIYPTGTSATTNTSYSWNFGDPASGVSNNTSTLPNPTHTFTIPGQTYTVTLITYTGPSPYYNSGIDTIIKQIYIQTNPIASFYINNTGNPPPADTCVPETIKIVNTSNVGGLGIPIYGWSVRYANGNPQIGNLAPGVSVITPNHPGDTTYSDPWFLFTAAGRYYVILTLINSCDTVKDTLEVLTCDLPEVSFSAIEIYYCGPGPQLICPQYELNCDSNTVTYHWEVNPNTVTFASGTTADSACPVIDFLSMGDYQVTSEITNACGAQEQTQLVHITNFISNNIIYSSDTNVCYGEAPIYIYINGSIPSGGVGSYGYQWLKNEGTGWDTITTATSQNLIITQPLYITTKYKRFVYDSGDCEDSSNEIQITVFPSIQNNLIFSDQQICLDSTPDLISGTAAFGSRDPITYQWYSKTSTSNWTLIINATGQSYQPGALIQTTWFRREAISAPCPSDFSSPVMITVCEPVSNNAINTAGNNPICQGTAPQINGSIPTGSCSSFSYQWQKSTDNINYDDISGVINRDYDDPTPIYIPTYFRRKVLPLSHICPDNISNFVLINILSSPIANAGTDVTIPPLSPVTLTASASSGASPYSYHWEPVGMISTDPNQQTITTQPLTTTTQFTVTVTDLNTCSGSDNVVVYVEGDPLSVTINANPTVICPGCPNGQPYLCAIANGGSGNYSYSWVSSPPGTISNQQCIYVCPTLTTIYTVTVWDGYVSVSSSVTITVNPVPVIISPLSLCICSGSAVNYSPSSTVPGTTYTWTTTPSSCNGNTSGSGNTILDILTNTGNTPCTVIYSITPYGPVPTNCVGQTDTLEVQVMPVPVVTNTTNQQTVISGQYTSVVNFTSNVSGASFNWQYFSTTCPGYVIYSLTSGTGPMPAQIVGILPGGPPSCTLTYIITPSISCPGGIQCPGTPWYYNIIINSQPAIYNLICPLPVCEGQSVTITLDDSETGIDYMLYKGTDSVPPAKPGTGEPLHWASITLSGSYSVKATNPGNSQSIWMNGICQVVINPNPIPNYLIGSTGNCPGDIITLNGSQPGVLYTLFRDGNSTGYTQQGPGPLQFYQNEPGLYTIKASYLSSGCWVWINGSILIMPNPEQFYLSPQGFLCAEQEFWLDSSQTGIHYYLECYPSNGSAVQIFGPWIGQSWQPIFFGPQNIPGTYKVHAYNTVSMCDIYMPDSAVIIANPIMYNITPDPSIVHCGLSEIGLANSQTGYTYHVHRINPNTGIPCSPPDPNFLPQTGSNGQPLSFLPINPPITPWTYVIIGWEPYLLCSKIMNGELTIETGPVKYWMNPIDTLCINQTIGQEITLEHSDLGIVYTLTNNTQTVFVQKDGGTSPLSFGNQNQLGTYIVTAQDTNNGCTETMLGSLVLLIKPSRYTILPQTPACPGAEIKLNGSDLQVTYTLHPPSGPLVSQPGNGIILTWGYKYQPGTYYITAQSDTTACNDTMNGIVVIHPKPAVYDIKEQGTWCEYKDIGMENAQANVTYEIMKLQGGIYTGTGITNSTIIPGGFWFGSPQPAGTYKVKATTVFSCDTLMRGIVVIEPQPIVDAGPPDTNVCSIPPYSIDLPGSASNYTSVQWSSPTNPGGSNFFPSPNVPTPQYTFTLQDLINHQVILTLKAFGSGTCSGVIVQDQIVVHIVAPVVNAGTDQVLCENEHVMLAGSITGGATEGIWTGGAGTFVPDRFTLTATYYPASSETGTTVTLTLTTTNANPCQNVSDTMNITIFDHLIPGVASSDQTFCYGEIPNPLTATPPAGGSSYIDYLWQQLIAGIWVDIDGQTNLSYAPPALFTTTQYRLTQKDTYCNPDQIVYTNVVTITVYGQLTAGTASANQTICYGEIPDTLTATPPAGGSPTIAYQWQQLIAGIWVDIGGQTNLSYAPPALFTTTQYRLRQKDTYCNPDQIVYTNEITIIVNPRPVPTIIPGTGNDTVCIDWTYSFSTEPGMNGYIWTVSPDGTIVSGLGTNEISISWSILGIKTITVTYTDPVTGCSAMVPTVFTVIVVPAPVPTISGPITPCAYSTNNIYYTEPGMTGYSWYISGGTITSGQGSNQITVSWGASGIFKSVSVNYTGSFGCPAPSLIVLWIIVIPLPTPTISGPNSVCVGSSGHTYYTEPNMTNYIWTVSSGGAITSGGSSTSSSVTVSWNTTGLQTVSVKYTNEFGCTAANPTNYNVNVHPLPVAILAGPDSVCEGATGNVYTTTAGMMNYLWNVSPGGTITAGGTPTSNTVTITWDTPGLQNVSVGYTNQDTCNTAFPAILPVLVSQNPVPIITGQDTICVSDTTIYFTQTGQSNYIWNISSGGVITSGLTTSAVTVVWNTPGAQSISVNYTNSANCTATSPTVFNVHAEPLPVPTISGPDTACIYSSNNIYTTESGKSAYLWQISSGNSFTGQGTDSIAVTWNIQGLQTVMVSYTDTNGCPASEPTSFDVYIGTLPEPYILGSDSLCQGDTCEYTTQTGMINYVWGVSSGGTIIAGGDTTNNWIIVAWGEPGPQTISVNFTNFFGCEATIPTVKNIMVFPIPSPVIQGDSTNICAYDSGFMYYTLPGQFNYMWNIAGGVITSGLGTNAVTVSWIIPGDGWISVNYSTIYGCSAPSPTQFHVMVDSLPEITINGPILTCLDSANNVYLTEQLMFQYEWSVTDGGIITGGGTQTSSSVTVTWKEAGEQFVSVNYKNSNGCTALTPKILPVMVNERPQPMFSYTQELCNDTIHFSEFSLPANGSNNGWQWKFGDGSPQILITSPPKLNGDTSHAYSSSGYYRVTLMTKNMNGCWDTASMQIHKSHCIHASFSKEPDSLYCQYSTVIFTDSSTPVQMIDQWKWSFGDNTIRTYTSHRDTLHHTYNAPGTYTISLVVSASSGGLPIYDTMNQLITVGPSPIAKFQVDPVCQDDSSQFINLSDSNGVILTYRMWNFGDPGSGTSDTSSLANPVHYYKSPGKYIATLTLGNIYGCESTCTHEVKILLRPKADFEYTKPCSGTEIELADNSLPGDTIIDKWKWHLGDPVYPYDTLHTPIVQYTYDVPGLYEIYLKVMDKNNCSDTIHQFLEIIPSPLSLFTIKESANGQPGNIQLQNESTGATNILWDFGNGKTSILENPIVTYEEDGSYTITLITWNEAGCYDTTFMKYEFMFHNLYVANAFYPESAIPLVRLFLPIGTNLKKYHLMIFDKWGHTLFESTMLDNGCGCPIEGWNGIFQGVMMPQDTYIWKIEAVFKDDKVWEGSDPGTGEISTMGTVTLIR